MASIKSQTMRWNLVLVFWTFLLYSMRRAFTGLILEALIA